MKRQLRVVPLIAALVAGPCAGCESATDPLVVGDIRYSAGIQLIPGTSWFAVLVTLENIGTTQAIRRYPASCPVAVRLYDSQGRRVYDERAQPCAPVDSITVTIDAGRTHTITSGTRTSASVAGDSLPVPAGYTVRGVPRTEHAVTIEVPAGSILLGVTSNAAR